MTLSLTMALVLAIYLSLALVGVAGYNRLVSFSLDATKSDCLSFWYVLNPIMAVTGVFLLYTYAYGIFGRDRT